MQKHASKKKHRTRKQQYQKLHTIDASSLVEGTPEPDSKSPLNRLTRILGRITDADSATFATVGNDDGSTASKSIGRIGSTASESIGNDGSTATSGDGPEDDDSSSEDIGTGSTASEAEPHAGTGSGKNIDTGADIDSVTASLTGTGSDVHVATTGEDEMAGSNVSVTERVTGVDIDKVPRNESVEGTVIGAEMATEPKQDSEVLKLDTDTELTEFSDTETATDGIDSANGSNAGTDIDIGSCSKTGAITDSLN